MSEQVMIGSARVTIRAPGTQDLCDRVAIIDHGKLIEINTPQALIDEHRNDAEVIQASRRGKITLEDVFIGLTGKTVRS